MSFKEEINKQELLKFESDYIIKKGNLPILFTAPHTMQQISELYTKAIAFTLWALALEKGDTAKISNIAYMTPFISLVWTSIVLKEKLSIYSIIGLIVIIIGIFIQMKKDKKEV